MARGNWNPDVIRPKTRCRYCGFVIKGGECVRVDGIVPAHRKCADRREVIYTIGEEVHKLVFATSADVDRMWKRLWGEMPMPAHGTSADFRECLFSFEVFIDRERGIRLAEFLDLCEGLQINQKG